MIPRTGIRRLTKLNTDHSHDLNEYHNAVVIPILSRLAVLEAAQPTPEPEPPTGPVTTIDPTGSIQAWINSDPVPGSTLILRGGTYRQTAFTARDTYGSLVGTADNPITIRAAAGETVTFPDVAGTTFAFWPNETSNRVGCSDVILEGIGFPNVSVDDEAAIVIGGAENDGAYRVNNITLRRLTGSIRSASRSVDHIVGLIRGCEDVVIEDCTFTGGGQGDAIVAYDQPAALRTTIRRSSFSDFARAPIQWWDYASPAVAGVAIDGCSFRRCASYAIDLRHHAASSVTNCTFDKMTEATAIYDPNTPGLTTKSGNRYGVA